MVDFFLLDKQFSNLLHVTEVGQISKTKVNVPDIVLVFIDQSCGGINHIINLFHGTNVFSPSIVYARNVLD